MKTTFKSLILLILILPISIACSEQSIRQTLETVNRTLEGDSSSLTSSEVASGLREALVIGTGNAVDFSGVVDGFYKNPELFIPFPPEAQKVKEVAMDLGLGNRVREFEETLNRAAETAVVKAKPIFVDAIMDMTIQDAFGILNGGDQAATDYLRSRTAARLQEAFRPEVEEAIKQVELTKYWSPLASAYNTSTRFTGGEPVDPDLTGYVTARATDGLFLLIGKEEEKIREDPAARVTELLKKVFG